MNAPESAAAAVDARPAPSAAIEAHLFNTLAVPSFLVDERGRVTAWNDRMEELTGRSAESVAGKKAWSAFFSKKRPTPHHPPTNQAPKPNPLDAARYRHQGFDRPSTGRPRRRCRSASIRHAEAADPQTARNRNNQTCSPYRAVTGSFGVPTYRW